MTDRQQITNELTNYIKSQVHSSATITPRTDLLESEVLDSLLMMDLIIHLESAYSIRVDDCEISPVHFRTVRHLARFVSGKLCGSSPVHAAPGQKTNDAFTT